MRLCVYSIFLLFLFLFCSSTDIKPHHVATAAPLAGNACGEAGEVTAHEVSAAGQEGVCILTCIFKEIGNIWPVFLFQLKIDTLCFIINLPVL